MVVPALLLSVIFEQLLMPQISSSSRNKDAPLILRFRSLEGSGVGIFVKEHILSVALLQNSVKRVYFKHLILLLEYLVHPLSESRWL